jgi:hypothetical protein
MASWDYNIQLPHPAAARLYEYAHAWVRANQPFDTLHLMCAALSRQMSDVPVSITIAQLLPPLVRERWLAATVAELLLLNTQVAAQRQPSPTLSQCIDLWRQRVVDPTQPITDVHMIATVVTIDVRIQRIMDLCGIAPQPFVQGLWQLSAQMTAQMFSQSGPFPSYVPDPFAPPVTGPHSVVRIGVVTGTLPPVMGMGTLPPVTGPQPALPLSPLPFGLPAAPSRPLRPEDLLPPGLLQAGGEGDAIRVEIARLVRYLDPSRGHRLARMHALEMNVFLDTLADTLQSGRTAVIAGRDGTPAAKLPLVLADRIAQSYKFEGKQDTLNGYHGIFRLDAAELCDLAAIPGKPEPQKVFEGVLREFARSPWLLMVDHVELLYDGSKGDEALRALFVGRGDTPAFGLYHMADEALADLRTRLGPKIALAPVQPASDDETRELIARFSLPEWELEGFTFTKNAFDGVIKLAPGVWVGGQRMALPYLVVDLAADTIRTVRDGDISIRAAARRAVTAIHQLRPRDLIWLRGDDWRPYDKALLDAQKEIQQLIEKPLPEQVNGKRQITRAYVTAQLLGGGRGEFRYP